MGDPFRVSGVRHIDRFDAPMPRPFNPPHAPIGAPLPDAFKQSLLRDPGRAPGAPPWNAHYSHSLRRQNEATQVAQAQSEIHSAAQNSNAAEAAREAAEVLERTPAHLRRRVLAGTEGDFRQIGANIQQLNEDDTRDTVNELARAADLAGPLDAHRITDPIAQAIVGGDMQQSDEGWFDVGQNKHHSEREFVDALEAAANKPGGELLALSLAESLDQRGASGWAAAVAARDATQVPDGNILAQASLLDDRARDALGGALNRLDELKARAINAAIGQLGIEGKIDDLEPGDTLTLSASGKVSPGLSIASGVSMEVARNTDGTYTLTAHGEASGGVGLGKLAEARAGLGGDIEYTFDNAAEAQRGAEALLRQGLASTSPGALLATSESAADRSFLSEHLTAIEIDTIGYVGADARFGLAGVESGGAEGDISGGSSLRIEFAGGEPVAAVLKHELVAKVTAENNTLTQRALDAISDGNTQEFEARYGFDPREWISGAVQGELTTTVEVRADLNSGANLTDIVRDPQTFFDSVPTEVSAGASLDLMKDDQGIHIEANAEGLAGNEIEGFVADVRDGRFAEAVRDIDGDASATWNTYTEEGLDTELDILVGSVSVENSVRHNGAVHDLAWPRIDYDALLTVMRG